MNLVDAGDAAALAAAAAVGLTDAIVTLTL